MWYYGQLGCDDRARLVLQDMLVHILPIFTVIETEEDRIKHNAGMEILATMGIWTPENTDLLVDAIVDVYNIRRKE